MIKDVIIYYLLVGDSHDYHFVKYLA